MSDSIAEHDIEISCGGSVREYFKILQTDGTPLPLTDHQILSHIRTMPFDDAPLIAEFDVEISLSDTGVFYLCLECTVTEGIIYRVGYYDILIIDPTGFRVYYCEGKIIFKRRVTKKQI